MPERLKRARLNRGLTLREAADQIGVNRETLRRLERGLGVNPGNAKLVADFYGFRVDEIWPEFHREGAAA